MQTLFLMAIHFLLAQDLPWTAVSKYYHNLVSYWVINIVNVFFFFASLDVNLPGSVDDISGIQNIRKAKVFLLEYL